jgi:hypothetical protein
MARNYAQISTAIWRNDDFKTLSVPAQHMYLLLSTQPDISAAGVLSLNAKRWSSRAKGVTTDDVVHALNELQAHRFVIFDTDTEELLVRSFVRWDGGYGNPKRRPIILRAAKEVESSAIRKSLAAELSRLDLPTEGLVDDFQPADDTATPVHDPYMDEDLFSQANSLSGSLSGSASSSDGVVVTKALVVDPTTHNPHSPSQATAAAKPRPEHGTRLPEDWIKTDDGKKSLAWAKREYPAVPLVEESLKFANYWLSKTGKDATKRDWYRTFQNWVIEANRRLPANRSNSQVGRLNGGMQAESNAPKNYAPNERCAQHQSQPAATCGSCRAEARRVKHTA